MKTLHEKISYIQTTLKAPKGQFNKYGNFKYRSLEDIQEALKPLLKETGLTLVLQDDIVLVGERVYVKATATLSDGENKIVTHAFAREPESKKGMDEAQITGATSSYARKYCLNGLFSIDDTKDADTEEYTAKAKQTTQKATQKTSIKQDVGKETIYEKLVKEKATQLKTSAKNIHSMIQKNLNIKYNNTTIDKFIAEAKKL